MFDISHENSPSTERASAVNRTLRTLEDIRCQSAIGKNSISRGQAIRRHCLECCGGSTKAVHECPSACCALHPFRDGKDPYRAPRSEKQKIAALENISPKASGGDDE